MAQKTPAWAGTISRRQPRARATGEPCRPPAPPAGHEGHQARVAAPLDRDGLDRLAQVGLQQGEDPGCRGLDIEAERFGHPDADGLLGPARSVEVEGTRRRLRRGPAGRAGGGRRLPSPRSPLARSRPGRDRIPPPRGRPGGGRPLSTRAIVPPPAPTEWTSTEATLRWWPPSSSPSSTGTAPSTADGDVARGPADLHRDHPGARPGPLIVHRRRRARSGDRGQGPEGAADRGRPGQGEVDGPGRHRLQRDRAAVRLQQEQGCGQAPFGQPGGQALEIATDDRDESGVDDRRRGPLVLADEGHQVGRGHGQRAPGHRWRASSAARRSWLGLR